MKRLLDYLRKTAHDGADDGSTDSQLLTQFLAGTDEAAFTTLVERHGPMVLAVARRLLGHDQDAEDVFQATFLVLVCRYGTVSPEATGGTQWICNGLLRDWVSWQSIPRFVDHFESLVACLKTLSPDGEVPVLHAPAGIQRVVGLCYIMVWAWHEHLRHSEMVRRQPQRRLVLLIEQDRGLPRPGQQGHGHSANEVHTGTDLFLAGKGLLAQPGP